MNHDHTVDWVHFRICRAESGPAFLGSLRHFRQDAIKAVAEIERAAREQDLLALIAPAHQLHRQARQFGAQRMAAVAGLIETLARDSVATGRARAELGPTVAELRQVFGETLRHFDRATNPVPATMSSRSPSRSSAPA